MNYIVLDMEWNQPYSKYKKHPGGVELRGDIIQIGAVKLNRRLKIVGEFNECVKPIFYKKLNRHVKDITHITDAELKASAELPEVWERFKKFCGRDARLITWGTDDIPMLRDNMIAYGIDPAQMPRDYNLQVIFNLQVSHENKQWSLESAVERLGLKENEHPHNALYDAISTAHIAQAIDFKRGVEEYDAVGSSNGVKITVFDGFKTMREAMGDKRATFTACPVCRNVLKAKGWTGSKYKKQTNAECDVHGEFTYRVSVYKKEEFFAAERKITLAAAK